jgi:7-keto-8-aminopelargonate synthetase-like enzyme
MSEGPTDERPRLKRRWTLGAMMGLIALAAVPLAWFTHQAREYARVEAASKAQVEFIMEQVKHIEKLIGERAVLEEKTARHRAEVRARLKERSKDAPPETLPTADEIEEPPR